MQLSANQARTLAWLALAVAFWWLFGLLAPVLLPFMLAAAMAYVLHPSVEWLHARHLPRWLGAGLALILLLLLLFALSLLIVPVLNHQLPLLRDQVPELLLRFNVWLQPWLARAGMSFQIDVDAVRALLGRLIAGHESDLIEGLLASLRIGGSAIATLLGNLVLTPVVAFYLLLDWSGLTARARSLVPLGWRDRAQRFFDDTDAVLGQYLRGQLLVMAALALFYSGGLALAGLQLALPIGVFTGLAVFVPYLGYGVGLVLGLLAALLQFQALPGVALVAGVYAAGQVLESMFLTPRLLGERIGLHPLAVIFALLAFGHLLGFVGVLVALPASAVLLVALRRLLDGYRRSPLYRNGKPSPDAGHTEPHR
ncbi:MAG: hypothetical protein RJA36_3768 [Pseudomonadota bacterium]|jgi:predicted PurR-regulated permease PerM